ncbi:autotransporter domain-containing protein [Microvirga lotononidis]|uniref:autotransporter domain-containing protein n=1 Tax=Microvirga lotononidis TaxID=864069 RepID=UPI002AF6C40E|nr:autotransporter domain-containing protein [Microvirga lotononidis]WQO30898.1 autotransporter domain-containing protein [Microvirga lotononidis]
MAFYALLASTSSLVLSLHCTPVSAQQNIIDNGNVVRIPGDSLAFGWDTIIGKNGAGTLFIEQGVTLESFDATLGENAGSSGTVYVREGSTWDLLQYSWDPFEIGRRGTGQLSIEGGSQVLSAGSVIGSGSGVILTGPGSKWDISQGRLGAYLDIGGSLEVTEGGALNVAGPIHIRDGGLAKVSGPNSKMLSSHDIKVEPTGTFIIEKGGKFESTDAVIESASSNTNNVIVTGAGSEWILADQIQLASDGSGNLLIQDGGLVHSPYLLLGRLEGSRGAVTVSGTDSALVSAEISIGTALGNLWTRGGEGVLRVEDDGGASTFFLTVGDSEASNGTAIVTGPGSSLAVRETLTVGAHGTGALIVEKGGSVFASDNNYFGFEAGSSATVEVTGTGSRLRVGELEVGTRGQASVTVADGASLEAASPIRMATNASAEGTLTVTGSSDRRATLTAYSLVGGSGKSSVMVDGGIIRAGAGVPLLRGFRPGSVVFGSGGAFLDTAGFNAGISSNLSGTGSLTKQGSGVLTLSEVNTYAGSTILESGGIALAGQGTIGVGFLQMAAGTTFDISGSSNGPSIGELRGSGAISLGANSLTVASGDFNGTISGTAGLAKQGSGTLTLGGASTYTGGTTVNEGSLVATTWDALGTGPVTNNATLVLRDASFSGGWHFAPVISGVGQLIKQGPGLLTLTGSHHYQGGTIIEGGGIDTTATGLGTGPVTNNASLWINEGGSAVFGAGSIQGTGNFRKWGAGTLTFDQANSYTGTTEISDGILALSGAGTVGSGTLNLAASGTLDISGADGSRTFGGLTGSGRVLLGSRSLAVNAGSSNSTFDGVIAGTGGLTKEGAGGLGLYGANTYTGTTSVAGGTLMVHGSLASTSTQIQAGATLAGSGNLAGSVAVQDGGTLAGTSNQTLTMGSLSLGSDATLKATLGGNGNSSLFAVTGNLTLDGRLVIDGASNLTGATRYTLLTYGGALTSTPLTVTSAPVGYKLSNFALDASSGKVALSLQDATGQQVWSGGSGLWGSAGWSYPAGGGLTSAWEGDTAVLRGRGGIVTVEGPQTFSALRFEADGYTVASGNAGELVLTDDGDASTLEGIRVESGLSATVSAPISGTATLAKDGAGTLNLTGSNTYTGGTAIGSGTLVGSVTSFGTGDILNNATLVIDQASDATFSQQISGNGLLTKRGAGRLNLTGISTLSGPTTVEQGRLAVNGSLANSVVTVTGGSLGGNGTVGGIVAQSGGMVAPGNSIGNLHVAGDVGFKPGSVYEVEVNAAGQSDRITASGKATLSGGTVRVLAEDGTYQPSTTYTVLTADAGVSGTFAGVSSNFAFLTPSLGYTANTVGLTLTRKIVPTDPTDPTHPSDPTDPHQPTPVAFNSVAATGNQFNVANAVEALGSGNRLFDAVLGQSAAGARQAFDGLSGEAYASAAGIALGSALRVQDTLLSRLRNSSMPTFTRAQGTYPAAFAADALGSIVDPVASTAPIFDPRRFALWGEGFGSWGKAGTNGNAAGLDISTGGFILGAEAQIDRTYTLGIAGGFTRTTFEADARLSSGSNDTVFAAVYGSGSWGHINLRLGATYAWHDIDVSRTIRFPNFADQAHASYDASTAQAFAEVGYAFDLGRVAIEPFAGASVLRLHTDGFAEEGGAAALTGYSQDQDLATTTLGLRAETRLGDDLPLTLRGMLGWRRAYGDVDPTALLAFAGGASSFVVAGTPIDRDALVAEAGLDWQATPDISLGIAYSGQVGSRAQEHSVKGNLTWRFGTY